uniref:CSON012804 protein n=1 Tax=Culicoides sonorensis TaxID=179676 RepID=A0A336KKM8_CULSO
MEIVKCCFEPVELPEFIETAYSKCTDPKLKAFNAILKINPNKQGSNVVSVSSWCPPSTLITDF